jgi:hypothetical protein
MPADKDIVSTNEAPEGEPVQTLTADLEGLIPRRRIRPSGGGNAGGDAANHVCVIETDEEENGDDVVVLDPPAHSGEMSESGQTAGVKPVGGGWGGGRGTLLNIFSLPVGGRAGPASLIDNDCDTVTPRPPEGSSRQRNGNEQEVVISDGDEVEAIMRNDEGVEREGAGASARRIADDDERAVVMDSWSEISDTWKCTQCTLINSSSGDKLQPDAAKPPDLGILGVWCVGFSLGFSLGCRF